MTPAIVFLVPSAGDTAQRAAAVLAGDLHAPAAAGAADVAVADAAAHLRALFAAGRPIVGVCAAGILIRALAPLLSDKGAEPPVIAVAEDGSSVVPLIGGHRGANGLARRLSEALGAHAAITTAGDLRFGIALDDPPPGWTLVNRADAKAVTAALLGGASARIVGDAPWLAEGRLPLRSDGEIALVATTEARAGGKSELVFAPRRLVVGIGCERHADPDAVAAFVAETLAGAGLAPQAVACVASLDLKADEPAVHAAAASLGVPARFFDAATLEAETPRLARPSEVVFREVGCHSVAEAAALAAAGRMARLVVPKRRGVRATCALAEASGVVDPCWAGRARGRLAIMGIGPGASDWRTPEATRFLQISDMIVGYSYYTRLIGEIAPHAEMQSYPIGAERERARYALDAAGAGRSVALISSGDPGIYAMASLVFETLEDQSLPDGARRAEIVVVPGISALQAAAARAGAPLGHDFCAISLSDLMTPWETIEIRIRAAAAADFVIAFYNPASSRRRTQLAAAKRILLAQRGPKTPVVVARQVGRDGETVETVALADLDPGSIDMMTLVIVGASTTRQVEAAGHRWTFTPRDYAREHQAGPAGRKPTPDTASDVSAGKDADPAPADGAPT